MEDNSAKHVLLRSAYRLLTSLARVLLRYSVSAQEAEQLLRRAFVDVAARDHGLRGRPTSKSRIASLTGLSRKEVALLLEHPSDLTPDRATPNRAIRVVSAWLREPAYQAGDGPAALPLSGEGQTFESLVIRYSGDVPYRALLRDLERTGVVAVRDGTVHLVQRGFVPRGDDLALLPLVGEEPAALLQTIDHNLQAGAGPRRFQRKAAFTALDEAGVRKLEEFAATRGQALLEELDALLAPHHAEGTDGAGRHHAGLALHVFVDPAPASAREPSQDPASAS